MNLKVLILFIVMPVLVFGKTERKSVKQIIMYDASITGDNFPSQLIMTPNSLKPVYVKEMDSEHFILRCQLKMPEEIYKLMDSVIAIYANSNAANQVSYVAFTYRIKKIEKDGYSSTFTLNADNTRVLLKTLTAIVRNRKGCQLITQILEDQLRWVRD